MSLEYVTAYKGVQFYCTTAERAFGPIMPDEDTGARFCGFLGCDPRSIAGPKLDAKWLEFQAVASVVANEVLIRIARDVDQLSDKLMHPCSAPELNRIDRRLDDLFGALTDYDPQPALAAKIADCNNVSASMRKELRKVDQRY